MQLYKTSRKAKIKFGGKTYTRTVYEGYDPAVNWWNDFVRLGSIGDNPRAFVALDSFENYTTRDEGTYMPGTWATR